MKFLVTCLMLLNHNYLPSLIHELFVNIHVLGPFHSRLSASRLIPSDEFSDTVLIQVFIMILQGRHVHDCSSCD